MQNEWWEENKGNFYSALNPIIPIESMMEMESLMTEFITVYGSAEVDTTGWRAIMQKANHDAMVQGTGLNCSSPEQIKVNQASILPIPSIATIMGWFRSSEAQEACMSCCIECCDCATDCRNMPWNSVSTAFWNGLKAGGICAAVSAVAGPVAWALCSATGIWTFNFSLAGSVWEIYRCGDKCVNSAHCRICPRAFSEHWLGADCSRAYLW